MTPRTRGPVDPGRRRRRRGGFIYVATLMCTLIVMTAVTMALHRSTRRVQTDRGDAAIRTARRLAMGEIDRMIARRRLSPDDLASDPVGVWSAASSHASVTAVGGPASSVRYLWDDGDGDLTDGSVSTLLMAADTGDAAYAVAVDVEPDRQPHPWLDYGLATFGPIRVQNSRRVEVQRGVWAGGGVTADDPGAELVGRSIEAPSFDADCSVWPSYRPLNDYPTVDGVLSYYWDRSVRLNPGWDPATDDETLDDDVLDTNNPWGPNSPDAIYRVRMGGHKLTIKKMTLDATLVVAGASVVEIDDPRTWRHPTDHVDCILVTDSPVKVKTDKLSANDTPVHFDGIIYTTDTFELSQSNKTPLIVRGSIYANVVEAKCDLRILADNRDVDLIPAIADTSRIRPVVGSYRRIAPP